MRLISLLFALALLGFVNTGWAQNVPTPPMTAAEEAKALQEQFGDEWAGRVVLPKGDADISKIEKIPSATGPRATKAWSGINLFLITLEWILYTIVAIMLLFTARHYYFTLNRLFGRQRHPYLDIDTALWPHITVMIAAHNEEAVIADSIKALLEVDYPSDRILLMPMNDRSSDRTKEIIDELVALHPGRITPFHRSSGKPGKAAALKDATELTTSDIIIVFDADYLPGRGLIKQLVAPFFDPEVGAVMGRVVPLNGGRNLLTRMLELERAGGYQVDQQARMNLGLLPQYGGTVGGIRVSALKSVGGWHDDVLAEDTDLTYRLLMGNWLTVYTNRSECYEEVPEDWQVRIRQIMRWSKGHNQALYRHFFKLLFSANVRWAQRLDGCLLLLVYALSPLLMFGWAIALVLYLFKPDLMLSGVLAIFATVAYSSLGNFAAFFEIGAACYLDGTRNRLRLLPLNVSGFLVSMVAISRATFNQMIWDRFKGANSFKWDKTVRYRQASKP
jgi:cellulose synthase/poly-beta-1,6-N-acetylglucosamine synthase-like glycosyltransferase